MGLLDTDFIEHDFVSFASIFKVNKGIEDLTVVNIVDKNYEYRDTYSWLSGGRSHREIVLLEDLLIDTVPITLDDKQRYRLDKDALSNLFINHIVVPKFRNTVRSVSKPWEIASSEDIVYYSLMANEKVPNEWFPSTYSTSRCLARFSLRYQPGISQK